MKEKVKSYSYEGYKEILDRVKGIINANHSKYYMIHAIESFQIEIETMLSERNSYYTSSDREIYDELSD